MTTDLQAVNGHAFSRLRLINAGQDIVPFTCLAATAIILNMDSKQHVFDFLAKPVGQTPVGVCVLHGSERF